MQDNSRAAGIRHDSRDGGRQDGRQWGGNAPRQGQDGWQYQQGRLTDGYGRDGWQSQGPGYQGGGYGRSDGRRGDWGRQGQSYGGNGGYRDDGYRGNGGGYGGRRDDREPVSYHVLASLGTISENRANNTTRELRLVSWNGRQPKLDLRDWGFHPDGSPRCFKGLTLFEDEALKLRDALIGYFAEKAGGEAQAQAPAAQGGDGQPAAPDMAGDTVPF